MSTTVTALKLLDALIIVGKLTEELNIGMAALAQLQAMRKTEGDGITLDDLNKLSDDAQDAINSI